MQISGIGKYFWTTRARLAANYVDVLFCSVALAMMSQVDLPGSSEPPGDTRKGYGVTHSWSIFSKGTVELCRAQAKALKSLKEEQVAILALQSKEEASCSVMRNLSDIAYIILMVLVILQQSVGTASTIHHFREPRDERWLPCINRRTLQWKKGCWQLGLTSSFPRLPLKGPKNKWHKVCSSLLKMFSSLLCFTPFSIA